MGSDETRHDIPTGTRLDTRRHRRTSAIIAVVAALTLGACADSDDDSAAATLSDQEAVEASDEMMAEDVADATDSGFGATADTTVENSERPATDGGFDIGVIGRDVIIEMRVVMSSDDIQRTVASVMASASTLGGGVASSDVNYGTADDQGFAVLVVKVPPEAVDRLLSGLDDTGEVLSINQNARDVTEQLVDLDVRIANARTSVANVREFMDRTENLNELVTLESELTRRQTELEQLEAQQRNLSERVALSTITIEVVPTASVPEPVSDEDESISDAFTSGWDAFATFAFGIAFVVAATLPFLVLGLALAVAIWMWTRRRERRNREIVPAESGDDDTVDREPEPAL